MDRKMQNKVKIIYFLTVNIFIMNSAKMRRGGGR